MIRVARSARTEPKVHAVSELDNLLPRAEVVVLILPSTDETKGLIGRRQLALMQQGALLVNAARGPIVDTDALVEALHAGRIRAAIDVTDPEPLPEGHPLVELPEPDDHAAHRWFEQRVFCHAPCARRRANCVAI